MELRFMDRALELAKLREGFCAPNPSVGAVIVKHGQILAEGCHWVHGSPHAEVVAMHALDKAALEGSELYVTLEPCCHHGKTPPCTQSIIDSGIDKVFYAELDPNPQVQGRGETLLSAHAVECVHVDHKPTQRFYAPYRHWRTTGRPWVSAKIATSLDGKISDEFGKPVRLSSATANNFTHSGRLVADAILTTVNTVSLDNPRLNVRLPGSDAVAKPIYILDARAELSLDARVWTTAASVTVFICDTADPRRVAPLEQKGAKCPTVPLDNADKLDIEFVLRYIAEVGTHRLWVECGGTMFRHLIEHERVNEAYVIATPHWLGDKATPAVAGTWPEFLTNAKHVCWESLGTDAVLKVEW